MAYVLLNDTIVARESASVDIEDRGYQFGDGIYEVVSVYGGRVFKLDEHLARLARSASELGIALPFKVREIKNKLLALFAADPVGDGMIYLQVTRGAAPRIHSFPEPPVSAQLVAYTRAGARPVQLQQSGVACTLTDDIRWLRCDIKSLNLLGNVLAKQKAAESGAYETIMHRGDTVTEGSSSNVYIVRNDRVITHPANNLILNGITRMTVEELCGKRGIPFVEQPFTVRELLEAEEAFITATTIDVVPVVEVDGQAIGAGIPGRVTRDIQAEFDRLIQAL